MTTLTKDNVSNLTFRTVQRRITAQIAPFQTGADETVVVSTADGDVVLPPNWKGGIILDDAGYPTPIAREDLKRLYEPIPA